MIELWVEGLETGGVSWSFQSCDYVILDSLPPIFSLCNPDPK